MAPYEALYGRKIESTIYRVVWDYDVEIQFDITYNKEPVRILAHEIKELRNKKLTLVKVLWQQHSVEEVT
ncbi:receptor-like protein kinase [Gossypium australe]|uniref:Receptor-like protein kinase n=1 Tax=Gossypium australe TaxID=47621 RepID=A0A5B6X0Y8_9ROSI|nr:receptor-like protein kinase [Gossypium australe]